MKKRWEEEKMAQIREEEAERVRLETEEQERKEREEEERRKAEERQARIDAGEEVEDEEEKQEEEEQPRKSYIHETDLVRVASPHVTVSQADLEEFMDYPQCTESAIGLKGSCRGAIIERMKPFGELTASVRSLERSVEEAPAEETPEQTPETSTVDQMAIFDQAEAIVMESLKRDYWEQYKQSPQYEKCLNFLWYQDRKVAPDDFYPMRVLGKGGFGLVKGMFACSGVRWLFSIICHKVLISSSFHLPLVTFQPVKKELLASYTP